ncbi:MAG: serine/threonine-protein kinase [Solirubrobacteraceae bacterium]
MSATSTSSGAIDGYSLRRLLARGGMGSVYLATQLSSGRPVAIKVLHETFREDATCVARCRREAELQRALEHPHIVPVLASGESELGPYIVMQMIDGPSLRTLIRVGQLAPPEALDLLGGIASALDYAHARGVLHRDVKPHNVLVEHGTHAWLADFGLTRAVEDATGLTSTGGLVGTFDYLAPEIAHGERASVSSDLYAFAVTIFQALTGSLPFAATSQAAALFAHAGAPRPRASEVAPELPPAVDAVLQSGMAALARDRPPSAGVLLEDVRSAIGLEPLAPAESATSQTSAVTVTSAGEPATAGADQSTAQRSEAAAADRAAAVGARRRRWRAIAAATCVGLLAAVAALIGASNRPSQRPPTRLEIYTETVGGLTHTWSDYADAGGAAGASIPTGTTVHVSCWIEGFKVDDGNKYWYRVASRPWSERYYASADAFYNDGATSGSLRGTPFLDPEVQQC